MPFRRKILFTINTSILTTCAYTYEPFVLNIQMLSRTTNISNMYLQRFYHLSNNSKIYATRDKMVGLYAQMKFVKRKINKHNTAAVQRHLNVVGRTNVHRTRNTARTSHEGSYHESRLIAVKILNHAISVISFPPP